MMLAGTDQTDVTDLDHFFDTHLVFDDMDLWEITVVKAGKNFVHIHFCYAMRCFTETIIVKVKTQGPGNVSKRLFDTLILCISVQLVGDQWCFKTMLEHGLAHLVCLHGVSGRDFKSRISSI